MSEFSRETLLNIIETDHVQCGEASALASMALAAMDSEPVEMPLDYLHGHKDGLEWAAQLAEANHPETGDWLYDDPIELAKAIRKGPDMPTAQPVEDSEPDCNERQLFCSTDTARMRKVISVSAGSEATPLYRHAQPVPVVSADLLHTAASAIEDLLTTKDRTGACVWFDLPFRLRSAANAQPAPVVQCPFPCGWDNLNKLAIQDAALVARGLVEGELTTEAHHQAAISNNDRLLKVISACRAAMLAAAPQSPGSEPATVPGKWIPVSERMPENDGAYLCWDNRYVTTYAFIFGAWQANQFIAKNITHWMPLPAGPQEVKGE